MNQEKKELAAAREGGGWENEEEIEMQRALKAFVARMQEAPPLPAPRIVTQLFDIPSPIRWPSAEVSAEH